MPAPPPALTRPGASLAPVPYATRPADVVRMREAGLATPAASDGYFLPLSAFGAFPKARP